MAPASVFTGDDGTALVSHGKLAFYLLLAKSIPHLGVTTVELKLTKFTRRKVKI